MRWWRGLLVMLLITSLSGCVVRIAYGWLDHIIPWYLDDYVELSSYQEEYFENKLEPVLSWHRYNELRRYYQLLRSLQQQMQAGISYAQADQFLIELTESWKRTMQEAAPLLGGLAQRLSDQQVESFIAKLKEELDKKRESYQSETREQKLKKHRDKIRSQLEFWIDEIRPAQEPLLAMWAEDKERSYGVWLEFRGRWIEELHQLLLQRKSARFPTQFARLLVAPELTAGRDYLEQGRGYRHALANWLVQLSLSLNKQQKAALDDRLGDLADDLSYLGRK